MNKTLKLVILIVSIGLCTLLLSSLFNYEDKSEMTLPTSTSTPTTTNHVFTDNMKDCQEKGGKYVLRIQPDGEIWLERCEISREFNYYNK
jgi:low affinity Fe/Cu permease